MMVVRHTFISCILITASLTPNMTTAKKKIFGFVTRVCYSVPVEYMDPNQICPQFILLFSVSPLLSLSHHIEHFIFYTRLKKKDEENHSISHRFREKQLPQADGLLYLSLSGFETNPGSQSGKQQAWPVSWDTVSTTEMSRVSLAWG